EEKKIWKAQPPKVLYHYTTAANFKSIMETKQVWATEVRYLNDASELIFGRDLVREITNQQIRERPRWPISTPMLERFERSFGDWQMAWAKAFVFCLSEEEDDLSQWTAYANRRGGVGIGFDTVTDIKVIWSIKSGGLDLDCDLVKMIYDEHQQRAFVKNIISA